MAISAAITERISDGSCTKIIGMFNFDNSYPAGGYTLAPAKVNLSRIYSLIVPDLQDSYYFCEWDRNTGKVKLYSSSGENSAFSRELTLTINGTTKAASYDTALATGALISVNSVWATNGASAGIRTQVTSTTDGTTPNLPGVGEFTINRTTKNLQFNVAEDATTCVVDFGITNYFQSLFTQVATGFDVDAALGGLYFEAVGV